jgi:hypothetical protein
MDIDAEPATIRALLTIPIARFLIHMTKIPEQEAIKAVQEAITDARHTIKVIAHGSPKEIEKELSYVKKIAAKNPLRPEVVIDPMIAKAKKIRPLSPKTKPSSPGGTSRS